MNKMKLIQFPCSFPIKIFGPNTDVFYEEAKRISLRHFPNLKDEQISRSLSKAKNYLALTVTVWAESQETLDDFYCEISKHPEIKMVL